MKTPVLNHPTASTPCGEWETSIPGRFEAVVRLYPEKVAVKTVDEVATYAEINTTANRLAREIVERRGCEAEPIAILVETGPRLIAAMLAVLKAGKWFILLDFSFPGQRNLALIHDSQAACVVSGKEIPEWLPGVFGDPARRFELDPQCRPADDRNLDRRIDPQAIATVVYTSGSTGEPKGVTWTHEDLLHRTMLRTRENEATVNDRIALLTSGTANTVTNCFFALLNGATICSFPVHKAGLGRLASWLAEERITICPFSATLFRSFVSGLTGGEIFPSLRIVRLRSETVSRRDFDLFKKYFGRPCKFVTGLSCSEAGQLTSFVLTHDDVVLEDTVPIGFPVPDKEIFLLDDEGSEVGPDGVGEIVVRSRSLSPGYWGKPELTALKFKVDPSGNGERLCFTGDLGLRLPDGCLLHKGRKDFRVKVRGFGVELAEIERCLSGHCGVRETAVIVHSDDGSDPRLTAYYTAAAAQPPPGQKELRDFVTAELPDYMVPARFVLLEKMPLTTNGKIDRRALPEPGKVRPEMSSPYIAPRDEVEQKLVLIWEEALDLRPIGVNDRFFDLGGDSLAVMRVLSEIGKQFQSDISLAAFFDSPTVAEVAAMVEGQPRQRSKDAPAAPMLRSRSWGENAAPLSFAQQRLWFLDRLDPGSCTYNLFSAYRLKGSLDVAALEQSFNEIIRRHDVLRTVFKSEDGNPIQVVLPHAAIMVPLIDLRSRGSEEERWRIARRRFTHEAQRPFDLSTGPLIRIRLLRLADDEHVLLRTMHHIVSDGWSEGVLFHELSELYRALSTGEPSPLTDLPAQYADYARCQRQWFVGERLESQLSYWKKQLDNIATLYLPTDRRREASRGRPGGRRYFVLSDEVSSNLKKLSRQHRATLFMTLLAAYQTLLYRYSNQTDIAIGSPVGGRNSKELDDLIGFFLNMLVLRLDLSGNPTFAETIARAREVCLGALSHHELPFEKLVEELHPDRNPGHNPLFQVTFAFQNTPRVPPRLRGLTMEELEVETGIARFDLHLFMEEVQGHLQGYLDYDANLFHGSTIERMLGHLQSLLEEIVAVPDHRISTIPLLSEAEKQQLLVEWNDTRKEYPKERCVHEMFELQVERTPDGTALVFEDKQLTYRELNQRANQIAHYLRRQGVQPDGFVALVMERSLEMVIAILGALKSGGAYVPIDPDLPAERIQFLLQDTRVKVLLTQEKIRAAFADFAGEVVCLDRDWTKLSVENAENPQNHTSGDHAAYVIYTSGSTGSPRGVVNIHDGVRNRLQWMQEAYCLTPSDRVLQKTPYAFDVSVWEVLWPLITGACLVIARPGGHRDSAYLVDVIRSQKITTLHFVPSMLEMFLQEAEDGDCSIVRQVICSGEALPYELQRRFCERMGAALHNLYGPTEASIDVTAWQCRGDSDCRVVPIGRPIANTQIYILDQHINPVPIGVAGELHIGGIGLARGYLDRPDLTAERFIPNPFSTQPGMRLYKTGDLARYLPNGNIEYLGRIDNQVKIRGYRIELGEIEAVLAQHPAIRQAVVLAELAPGDKRVVGYVVTQPGGAFEVEEVSSYLKQKLPGYMIPSAWVLLEALPLTPNGKMDRKALPAWNHIRPESMKHYQAPRTAVEKALVDIWSEVLHVDNVGIHDDFFDLGGHSLLITQLIVRACNAFGIEVPLRTVFDSPTIAQFAEAIGRIKAVTRSHEECEIFAGAEELPAEMLTGWKTTGKD